jgi:predicted nucleic acid-binding protein
LEVSRIFWDTNLFIYLLEGTGETLKLTQRLLDRMVERQDELLTSTFTLGEVLVKPLEIGRRDVADRYERWLSSTGIRLLPFDREAARIYAEVRHDRTVRPPDAIQLAWRRGR